MPYKSGPQETPSRPMDSDQKGESGGGSYPNPHSGKEDGDFQGGSSDRRYYGPDDNENATSRDE